MGKIELCLLVIPAVDCVIRTLEKPVFAVVHEFHRGQLRCLVVEEPLELRPRDQSRSGDVVLHLDFQRRIEILAQSEGAPRIMRVEADAQIGGHQFAGPETQFVGRQTVDRVDTEVLPPMLAPRRAVEPLEDENQLFDVLRNAFEPRVVIRRESGRRGQQLDDRTQRTARAEQFATVRPVARRIGIAVGVIVAQQLVDAVEIRLEVRHENRSLQDGVGDRFGDFRFAAARDRARFVA